MRRWLWQFVRNNFGAGLLVFVPLFVTIWVIYTAFSWVNEPLARLFKMPEPGQTGIVAGIARFLHGTFGPHVEVLSKPGAALVLLIVIIFVVGFLARTFLGRIFIKLGERIVSRLPVVRIIYTALKQILQALLLGAGRQFRGVVLFEYPRKGIHSIGFVTGAAQGQLRGGSGEERVNIFLPTTPNPTSGFLLMIPRKDLTYLDMTVEEAVKVIMSGGMLSPSEAEGAAASGPVRVANPSLAREGAGGAKEDGDGGEKGAQ